MENLADKAVRAPFPNRDHQQDHEARGFKNTTCQNSLILRRCCNCIGNSEPLQAPSQSYHSGRRLSAGICEGMRDAYVASRSAATPQWVDVHIVGRTRPLENEQSAPLYNFSRIVGRTRPLENEHQSAPIYIFFPRKSVLLEGYIYI